VICPLTIFEGRLRAQTWQEGYEEAFMQFWLQRILYYEASMQVFIAVYTLLGLIVALTWFRFLHQKIIRSVGGECHRREYRAKAIFITIICYPRR